MKQRILSAIAATLCTLTLFCCIAPVSAQAKAPSTEGDAVVQSDDVRWYYRTDNNGNREKRLWSVTEMRWLTGWLPA